MALTLKSRLLDAHLFFFREGDAYTVPSAGTCAADSKPGANDPAWIDLGAIEEWEYDLGGGQDIEAWKPVAGRLVLKDIIEIKEKLTVKFTTNEMTALAFENFFRSNNTLSSLSGQFNPLAGRLTKGWLHAQQYDQDGTLCLALDLWGRLKCAGGIKGGSEIIRPSFEFVALYSPLNTAEIEPD